MSRTVTVVSAASGASADLRLDPAATLADVLPELMRLTASTTTSVTRDGLAMDPRQPVAHLHDGDVLVLGPPGPPPAPAVVQLEVTAGPDAGQVVALPTGRWLLGRAAGGGVVVTDPRVSRHHLELAVDPAGDVTVTDLDSSNGTWLQDRLAPGQPVPWPSGVELRCGSTRIVHGRSTTPAATAAGLVGTITVNRPPRLRPADEPTTVTFPSPPTPATAGRLPLVASLAPLLAGVLLALVMHRWEFLAFAAMSPMVVLGQAATDRWAARRAHRAATREYAAATAAAAHALREAVTAERARRHEDAPDLGSVVVAALRRTSLLWHRGADDDDMLMLRLGLGDLPSAVRVDGDQPTPKVCDVPVCLDLRANRLVGMCGDAAAAMVRSLLLQATVLVGPADLAVSVLAPGRGASWGWARWLPHADLAVTADQLRARMDTLRANADQRVRLVLVDGTTDPGVASALAELVNTSVIWIAGSESQLPATCDAVVTVSSGDMTRVHVRTATASNDDIVADLVDPTVAEAVSRALCPLRDGRVATACLPTTVAWSDLHDVPLGQATAAQALQRRWRSGPSTTVCLGVGVEGPYVVDLQADGPHLLVAGTTGAGKSELLQSLVASLVTANSPRDLNLLLVDFKGGAAFGPCERLPHTLGVLTDLDPAATARAIDSLTAELRRRERLLAASGAPDLDTWRVNAARDGDKDAAMPRLVIVVDEFATLADELPEFVGGLVGIAQRGRSLGVHLVLATQRPEGAVSADIRANTRLRICLAVARDAESRDVIDSPRATSISRSTPGRAFVRIGAQDLVEVQTARVAGPARLGLHDNRTARVELVPLLAWGQALSPMPPGPDAATELDLLATAATAAAADASGTTAVRPWLPPLPTEIALSGLSGPNGQVAIGLLDLPQLQAQPPLTLSPADSDAVLLVGGPRSGRTSAVLTMATALAAGASPDRQHIWAIDSGRGLGTLRQLPHTGAVVDARDIELVDRLLTFLTAQVEGRRGTSLQDAPRLLLIVDSWDGLAASAESDAGRCQDLLLRLLTHGPAAGLRIVVTSDRSGLTGRLASAVGHRLCLRLSDPADYAMLGLATRRVPTTMPPGRCIRVEDLAVAQFAIVDPASHEAARSWPVADVPARRFDPLPTRIPLHAFRPSTGGLIVGLGGDDLTPVLIDPQEAGGCFLVAGPPRSGRSTTLVSIAAQLRGRPVVALCARHGPLRQRRDLACVADLADPDQTQQALQAVAAGATLLVDDVDLVDDPVVLDGIEAAVRKARDGHGFVVLAGTTDAMTASFRGPVAQARRGRSGLLLRPDGPHDGELLGVRLRRRPGHTDPPGRGVLAMHGRLVPVQVPDPA